MKPSQMNKLISQLNGCLGWTKFGVIGLNNWEATQVLEKWFDWYLEIHKNEDQSEK